MGNRSVARYQIEEDTDSPLPCFLDEGLHRLVRAISRCHAEVVRDVVPGIAERRSETWVEPDGVDAEPLQVVKPGNHAIEIADPIAIRIHKRLRIDLIDYCFG